MFALHFCSWGNMDNSTKRQKEKIVDAFVSRGVSGVCLVTSKLLITRLQAGKVIEGYLVFVDMKLRHYWCSIDEANHDLVSTINIRLGTNIFKGRLSQIPSNDYQYVSEMNKVELKEFEAGFRCYTTKAYCKNASRWIRALKRPWLQYHC